MSSYAVLAITRRIWREVARATKAQRDPFVAEVQASTDPEERLAHAHGLDGNPPQTFAHIGHAWGVSRQRIHQLHVRALVRLAHPSASRALRTCLAYGVYGWAAFFLVLGGWNLAGGYWYLTIARSASARS